MDEKSSLEGSSAGPPGYMVAIAVLIATDRRVQFLALLNRRLQVFRLAPIRLADSDRFRGVGPPFCTTDSLAVLAHYVGMRPSTQTETTEKAPVVRVRRATATQRLLTLTQASEQYGIPTRSLHDLITRGVLTCVRFPDARRLWLDRADVEQMIAGAKARRA
jgi:hypothetical protein